MKYGARMLFVVGLLVFVSGSSVWAQRMQVSPEERAKRLKDSLALNDDQLAKVVKIYQDVDKKRNSLRESITGLAFRSALHRSICNDVSRWTVVTDFVMTVLICSSFSTAAIICQLTEQSQRAESLGDQSVTH